MRCSFLLAVTAALALLAGCGGGGESSPTIAQLRGSQFMATKVVGHTLVKGAFPSLSFYGDAVTASGGGCNSGDGAARMRGGRLLVSGLGSTLVGCAVALEHQDDWFLDFMTTRPTATTQDNGKTLILARGDQTVTFGRQGPSGGPTPIEGPHWTAVSMIQPNGSHVAIEGPMIKPAFHLKGNDVGFFTGCNQGATTAKVTMHNVQFGSKSTTGSRTCSAYVSRVERLFLQVVRGNPTYTFEGRSLALRQGNVGLDFIER